jgi:hypothetical protein
MAVLTLLSCWAEILSIFTTKGLEGSFFDFGFTDLLINRTSLDKTDLAAHLISGFPQFIPLGQSKNPFHPLTMDTQDGEARQLHLPPLSG